MEKKPPPVEIKSVSIHRHLNVHKESNMNGKSEASQLEVVSSEESEDEKLIDLDSDEVDCTIIEDDIDLEELMKQKV